MSKTIVPLLNTALSNTYCLYLKTQNYHWNVTGSDFAQLHVLFETQYNELSLAVDTLAERIRSLGQKSPGSFKAFLKLATINEAKDNITAKKMVEDLAKSHAQLANDFSKAMQAHSIDSVTGDLFIQRATYHEKTTWMLKALLE
jgi:starvation-inducible DNA-binding protein